MNCPSCKTFSETDPTQDCCSNCGLVFEDGSIIESYISNSANTGRASVYLTDHLANSVDLKKRNFRAKKLLKSCVITLNLQGLEEKAYYLYEKLSKSTPRLNNKGDYLVYTCLYVAARQENKPITFKSFSNFSTQVDHFKLGRLYKKVISRLDIAPVQSFPDSGILRLYSSLIEGLKKDKEEGSIEFTVDISSLNSFEIMKTAEEILRLSKIAMLNTGREEAGLVAASLIIALQYHLNLFLPYEATKKLLSYQVGGTGAYSRYKEIKEFFKVSLSHLLGDCNIIQERFYRYIPALYDLDENSLEVASPSRTLKRCAKEAVSQNMYTILASQKLKGQLESNKFELYSTQPEILIREEALKNNFTFETVCKLSHRDILLQLKDKLSSAEIPSSIELSDKDLTEKEFQSIYISEAEQNSK